MAFLPFWFVTSVNTFLILIFVTLYLRQTVIHKIDSTAAYALGLVIYIWFPNFEMVMTKMFPNRALHTMVSCNLLYVYIFLNTGILHYLWWSWCVFPALTAPIVTLFIYFLLRWPFKIILMANWDNMNSVQFHRALYLTNISIDVIYHMQRPNRMLSVTDHN